MIWKPVIEIVALLLAGLISQPIEKAVHEAKLREAERAQRTAVPDWPPHLIDPE